MWPGLWVSREVPRPSIDQSDRYRSITRRLAVGARVARRLTSARCGWWALPVTCVLHPARQRQRRRLFLDSPCGDGTIIRWCGTVRRAIRGARHVKHGDSSQLALRSSWSRHVRPPAACVARAVGDVPVSATRVHRAGRGEGFGFWSGNRTDRPKIISPFLGWLLMGPQLKASSPYIASWTVMSPWNSSSCVKWACSASNGPIRVRGAAPPGRNRAMVSRSGRNAGGSTDLADARSAFFFRTLRLFFFARSDRT